ncbi:MAG TPA: SpoIID/LytB domain-containing protein, partial [Thermoleophilia bacterium]|nr:SpoIID/LytB domain-containing protein [Thermoleophilia bacterium]
GGAGSTTEVVPPGSLANLLFRDGGVHIVTVAGGGRGPYAKVEVRPGTGGRVKVQFRISSGDAIRVLDAREYWGKIQVEPSTTSGNLIAYNFVPIEKYLRSIAEVIPNWAQSTSSAYAPEAVKAQAVAARTYAVANKDPYLNDNQWDQVYRGYTYEALYPGIGEAAEQTLDSQGRGLILRYNGKVVVSFFSSSSGGYTSPWYPAATYPYLPAKPDPYSLAAPTSNPGYAWTFSISPADLSAAVDGMSDTGGNAVHIGMLDRVEVASRDTSDPGSHVATFRLIGVNGSAVVSASSLRGRLGYGQMRSTLVVRITNPRVFSDVPSGHFFLTEIERIALAGIVQGFPDGKFSPDASVARWQFAKMVVGLHNVLLADDQIAVVDVGTSPFADVPAQPGVLGDESDWVAAAKNAGLVKGFTETVFMPYASVQRDQMATMLVRAMRWEDEAAALPSDTPGFADVAPGSTHWADTRYLKSLGVLRGYEEPPGSGTFVLRWADPTLRMHAAAVLCRVLDLPAG